MPLVFAAVRRGHFHLIRAGVADGKGVPETVADNPLVFATLTAPSFGAVHGGAGNHAAAPAAAPTPDALTDSPRPASGCTNRTTRHMGSRCARTATDPRPDGPPIMMTTGEVAELLHVDASTVCRW